MKLTHQTAIVLLCLLFSSCSPSKNTSKATPTPTTIINQLMELKPEEKPYISLVPSSDGHWLKLKIENLPSFIEQIEYELVYQAEDNGLLIEKGIGDLIKEVDGPKLERDLLLGTSSCTNGCKYKYDTGITGGTIDLTFISQERGTASFNTSFLLKTGAQLKKDKQLSFDPENFSISLTTNSNDFFTILKNFGYPEKPSVSSIISVFSSGPGQAKITSVQPESYTKDNLNLLSGDYLSP